MSDGSMAEVSLIILTKNVGDKLRLVLDKVYAQVPKVELEVIIVDSGSTDTTLAVAGKYPTIIREIKSEEFSHSRTRNLGATMSSGSYLVYLGGDAIPCDNHWLSKLLSPLRSGETDVVYGSQIAYDWSKPNERFFYGYFYPDKRSRLEMEDSANPSKFYLENVFVSDVNAAMKRKTWEDISFDEHISFTEDKDFAIRALAKGYGVLYEPTAAVYHSHSYTLGLLAKRRYNDGRMFSYACMLQKSNPNSKRGFISEGLKYWYSELRFLYGEGYILWIPYAIIYDILFFASFKIGEIMFKIGQNTEQKF
jgi:rhamnosyltransferase